jgi:MFS family permease
MRAGPGGAAGLGGDFAKLWTANAVSNLGDGVTRVAAPLLMASLTGDPALVAGAVLAQQLPWLLSLPSGASGDRLDRRRLLVAVNLLRGAAVLLRAGLVVEALCQLSLALTRRPWVASATLVLFGAHAMVWGVVTVSLRQRVVPDRPRGRVNSV